MGVHRIFGSYHHVYRHFEQSGMLLFGRKRATLAEARQQIGLDRARLSFLGSEQQFSDYNRLWDEYDIDYYCQGDVESFSFIAMFLSQPDYKNKQAALAVATNDMSLVTKLEVRFAYLDQRGRSCGCSLSVSQSDPRFWLLSVMRGTNLRRSEREVAIFMSEQAAAVNPALYQDTVSLYSMRSELKELMNQDLIFELIMKLFTDQQNVDLAAVTFLNGHLENATNMDARLLQLRFLEWRLNAGAITLSDAGATRDARALSELAGFLAGRGQRFFQQSDSVKEVNAPSYYKDCKALLCETKAQLSHVHVVQKLLVNALLFGLSLGVGYLLAALYLRRLAVYNPQTPAETTLNEACYGFKGLQC